MSTSTMSTPNSMAASMAASEFSGAVFHDPRWATTSTRGWVRDNRVEIGKRGLVIVEEDTRDIRVLWFRRKEEKETGRGQTLPMPAAMRSSRMIRPEIKNTATAGTS